jgi:hypothetical protein
LRASYTRRWTRFISGSNKNDNVNNVTFEGARIVAVQALFDSRFLM